jgi:non-heme chloroperoxidase
MGVNVCLEYLRTISDKIIGSVMISGTVAPPHEVMFDSNIFEFISPLAKTIKKKFPRIYQGIWANSGKLPLVQKWVHEGGFNTGRVDMEFIQQYVNKIGKLDPNIFFQCLEEMRRQNSSIYLNELNTRTLVIAGDKDKVIPFHVQVELHQKLKNSELHVVGEGSHVPQVDFPESINEAIEEFILRLIR